MCVACNNISIGIMYSEFKMDERLGDGKVQILAKKKHNRLQRVMIYIIELMKHAYIYKKINLFNYNAIYLFLITLSFENLISRFHSPTIMRQNL